MADTGWVHAGSALNDTVLGAGQDWTALGNLVSNNNLDSECAIRASGQDVYSDTLYARQYGHSLGDDATVDGVQARYERHVVWAGAQGSNQVRESAERFITDGNAATGQNFADNGAWTTARTLVTYGSATNPQSLTASELDGTNFGFGIRAYLDSASKAGATPKVDYCQTKIFYTTPPAAPSNVTAVQDDKTIVITWRDNATDENHYQVQVSVNGGGYTTLTSTLAANTTRYTDTTGYAVGDTLDYRVRALKTSGPDSAFANAAQITFVSTFVPQVIIIGSMAGLASALSSVLGCLLRKVRFA